MFFYGRRHLGRQLLDHLVRLEEQRWRDREALHAPWMKRVVCTGVLKKVISVARPLVRSGFVSRCL